MAMSGSELINNGVMQNLAEDAGKASQAIQLASLGLRAAQHVLDNKGLKEDDAKMVNTVIDELVDEIFNIDREDDIDFKNDAALKEEYKEFREMLKENMRVGLKEIQTVKGKKKEVSVANHPVLVELTQTDAERDIVAENIANKADKKQVVPYKDKVNGLIGEFDDYIVDHKGKFYASTNMSGALMLGVKNMHLLALRWMARKSETNGEKPRKVVAMVKKHLEEATKAAHTTIMGGRHRFGKCFNFQGDKSEFQKSLDRVSGQRNEITVGIQRCQASRSFDSYLNTEFEHTDEIERQIIFMGLRLLDKNAMESNDENQMSYISVGGRFGPGANKEINQWLDGIFRGLVKPQNKLHKWDVKTLVAESRRVFNDVQQLIDDLDAGKIKLPDFVKEKGLDQEIAKKLLARILHGVACTRIRRAWLRTVDNALRDNGEIAVCSEEEFQFIHMYLKYIDEELDEAIDQIQTKNKVAKAAFDDITTRKKERINAIKEQIGSKGTKEVFVSDKAYIMQSQKKIKASQNALQENSNNMIEYYKRKNANTFNIYFRTSEIDDDDALIRKEIEELESIYVIQETDDNSGDEKVTYKLAYSGPNGKTVHKEITKDNDKALYNIVADMAENERVFANANKPYSGHSYTDFIEKAEAFVRKNNGFMHPEADKCNGSIKNFQAQVFALAVIEVNNPNFGHGYKGQYHGSKYDEDKYDRYTNKHRLRAQFKNSNLDNKRARYLRASIEGLTKVQEAFSELNKEFELGQKFVCLKEADGKKYGITTYIKHNKKCFRVNAISLNMNFTLDEKDRRIIENDPFYKRFIVKDGNRTFKVKANEDAKVKEYPYYKVNFEAIETEADLLKVKKLFSIIKDAGKKKTKDIVNSIKIENEELVSYSFDQSSQSLDAIDSAVKGIEKFQTEKVQTQESAQVRADSLAKVVSSTRESNVSLRKQNISMAESLDKAEANAEEIKKVNDENKVEIDKLTKENIRHKEVAIKFIEAIRESIAKAEAKVSEYNQYKLDHSPKFKGDRVALDQGKSMELNKQAVDAHSEELKAYEEEVSKYEERAKNAIFQCSSAFAQINGMLNHFENEIEEHFDKQDESLKKLEKNSEEISKQLTALKKELQELKNINEQYKAQLKVMQRNAKKHQEESIANAPDLCESKLRKSRKDNLKKRTSRNAPVAQWKVTKEDYLKDLVKTVNNFKFMDHTQQAKVCQTIMEDEEDAAQSQRILTRRKTGWFGKDRDGQDTWACKALKEVIASYESGVPRDDIYYYPNGDKSKAIKLPETICRAPLKEITVDDELEIEDSHSNIAQNTNHMSERLGGNRTSSNESQPRITSTSGTIVGNLNGNNSNNSNIPSNDDVNEQTLKIEKRTDNVHSVQ